MRSGRKKSYYAGLYYRLSQEDGDKAESDSIQNQRELIKDFLRKHPEISNYREFADDGYSGTNFDRPAFKKMMEEVEQGRVDCIIVKDLSRLGRNYIETGRYLERIFPAYEVRFIAINDNYDTISENKDSDQIIVPFKNLINDAYCRDISIKVRSQLDVMRKNGKFIGSFACYGYRKDPADKNHLLIDEYPASIVQMIFAMKLDGYSQSKIANRLNELGVLTPLEYKRACGFNYNSGYRVSEDPKWCPATVLRVLTNEVYTGMVVQGKNRKLNYKIKQCKPIDRAEWVRVPDMHDAIVPRTIFDRVQKLLELDTRTAPGEERVDCLSGLVKCGDCGQNMVRRSTVKNGKKYFYYHCSTHKAGDGCASHLIRTDFLYDAVLLQVQMMIQQVIDAEQFLNQLDKIPHRAAQIQVLKNQMKALNATIERYSSLKQHVYQDMVDNVVTKEEYQGLSRRFNQKVEEAQRTEQEIKSHIERLNPERILKQEWLQDLKQYRNLKQLDRKIAVCLIDSILVYDKKRIQIQLRNMDEITALIACAEELEEGSEVV